MRGGLTVLSSENTSLPNFDEKVPWQLSFLCTDAIPNDQTFAGICDSKQHLQQQARVPDAFVGIPGEAGTFCVLDSAAFVALDRIS